ncbi:MAG: hypothetical protein K2L87_01710, partial [Clostridiales bacterium]|nr:hypothetical protein [Clostridiales bacterium]
CSCFCCNSFGCNGSSRNGCGCGCNNGWNGSSRNGCGCGCNRGNDCVTSDSYYARQYALVSVSGCGCGCNTCSCNRG